MLTLELDEIKKIIPHREPFIFLNKIYNMLIDLLKKISLKSTCNTYIKNSSKLDNSKYVDINIKYPDNPDILDLLDYKYLRCSNIENYRFKKKIGKIYYILWFKKL